MKKKSLLALVFVLLIMISKAQTTFSEPILIASQNVPVFVYTCDIDQDGDSDVFSAFYFENTIGWYENIDGNGNFSELKIITASAEGAYSVFACNIDNDNELDLVTASWLDNTIAWYKNTDGNGNFSQQQTISTNANGAHCVYACDIDGDGDNDVLSASFEDHKIAWYENTDGNGNFGNQQVITNSAINALNVFAIDIDGDEDNDVISASTGDDKIAWYENIDGNGTFSQHIITTSADGAYCVFSCDIDNDDDNDIFAASALDNTMAWYENIDGNGTFSQHIISTSAEGVEHLYACDLDNDLDYDVLSACYMGDKVAWYENDGSGTFSEEQVISTSSEGVFAICATDLDGDLDNDVLTAVAEGDRFEWYRNELSTSTIDEQYISIPSIKDLSNYPNPFNTHIFPDCEIPLLNSN